MSQSEYEPSPILRDSPTPAGTPSGKALVYRQDVLDYIVGMLCSLRELSLKAGQDSLVKSLETAYYQAEAARRAKATAAESA
jgi:hypothetical protein